MGRAFAVLTSAVAVAVCLLLSLVSPVAASPVAKAPVAGPPVPVTQVTTHGIYKSVVTCPRWVGPTGGPVPLLAPPPVARPAGPRPARGVPQPVYAPIARCTVLFLKDAPAVVHHKAPSCARGRFMLAGRHRVRLVCCARRVGHRMRLRLLRSCIVLDTGYGGMARQVSRHTPSAAALGRAIVRHARIVPHRRAIPRHPRAAAHRRPARRQGRQ